MSEIPEFSELESCEQKLKVAMMQAEHIVSENNRLRAELEALRKENGEIRMLNIEVTRANSRFCVELEDERGKVKRMKAFEKLVDAVYEASTPLKEFAGLRKDQWNTLYEYLRDREAWEEWEEEYSTACRQIAEGLSE